MQVGSYVKENLVKITTAARKRSRICLVAYSQYSLKYSQYSLKYITELQTITHTHTQKDCLSPTRLSMRFYLQSSKEWYIPASSFINKLLSYYNTPIISYFAGYSYISAEFISIVGTILVFLGIICITENVIPLFPSYPFSNGTSYGDIFHVMHS